VFVVLRRDELVVAPVMHYLIRATKHIYFIDW